MQVHYGFMWNEFLREVIDPMSEQSAQKRWESGNSKRNFEIILGDCPEPPVTIVAIPRGEDPGSLNVSFFDEQGRRALTYGFALHSDENRLFLGDIWGWTWDSPDKRETTDAATIDEYQFTPDGHSRHSVHHVGERTKDTTTAESVPMQLNWEPLPAFGDWASIARRHRDLPPDHPSNLVR